MAPTAEATGEATRARSLLRTSGAPLASSGLSMASSFWVPYTQHALAPTTGTPIGMLHT